MFWIIILVIIIFLISYLKKLNLKFQFKKWVSEYSELHDYDEDKIRVLLSDIGLTSFYYYGENIPYGRAKWFVEGDKNFIKLSDATDELEFFGFTPVRSKIEEEFLEYGMLLTQDGIYYRIQLKNKYRTKVESKKYLRESRFFRFDGLWRVTKKQDEVLLYYPTEVVQFKFPLEEKIDNFVIQLNHLIGTGYTADLYTNYIKQEVEEYITSQDNFDVTDKGTRIGSFVGLNWLFGNHLKDIQFNATASAKQAHGYAAEHANDIIDKVIHPFKDVRQVGQDNAKNGADRRVGNQFIQTKYCSNAKNTINAAFDKKVDGGMYRYKNMQLEVPRDQYNDAIQLMKDKIRDGKVPGHTDANDAYKIIRKGHVTYTESKLIAQGGNITSLKYDAVDGAIQVLPAAGISFVIVFAKAKWSGNSTKESASLALRSSAKTMVMGTIVYASSQQIGKILPNTKIGSKLITKITDVTGKEVTKQAIARGAAGAISFVIIFGPDTFDALTGRISKQQLLKNTLVSSSALGGSAIGAAAGSVVPVIGNLVGAIAGATAAAVGSKKILDHFIEDDRVEMFAILKEEFIDVVMSVTLTEEEFSQVQETIFDKHLGKKLKKMFKNKQSVTNRKYTREDIIEKVLLNVTSARPQIDDNSILEVVGYAEDELATL